MHLFYYFKRNHIFENKRQSPIRKDNEGTLEPRPEYSYWVNRCFRRTEDITGNSLHSLFASPMFPCWRRQWHPTLAWKIPWMEEPGRLQSMGSLRVGHDWATSLWLFTFMLWRRKWQPTPVFLPGESQGRGSLVGCCLWGRKSRTWLKWLRSSSSSTCFTCICCSTRIRSLFTWLYEKKNMQMK